MLKRLFVCVLTAFVWATAVSAQERTVTRLPEVRKSAAAGDFADFKGNNTGFWGAAEVVGGYSCQRHSSNIPTAELDVVGGYRFGEYLRLGIGVGVRYYINGTDLRWKDLSVSAPLFLNVRGNFESAAFRSVVPYYSFDIGASIGDGAMLRPAIGLRIGERRSVFLVAIGYTAQQMGVRVDAVNPEALSVPFTREKKFVSFINLKLGYEF